MKKAFFTKKHQGYRTHRTYHLPGYVDSFDEYKQQFKLNHYAFWGFLKYRSELLFEEIIPNHVIVHEMFIPYNSDWKTACPEEIRDFYHFRGEPEKNV